MLDEKNLLKEWQEVSHRKREVFDTLCRLTGSWAVAVLCSELEKLACEEIDLLRELEKFGIRNWEDAMRRLCRLEE